MTLSTIRNNPAKQKKVKTKKQKAIAATCAVAFWLLVWHVVSLCVGSELVLVSPVKVVQTLFTVIFDPDFLKKNMVLSEDSTNGRLFCSLLFAIVRMNLTLTERFIT